MKKSILKASIASQQERKIFNPTINLDHLSPYIQPQETYIYNICFDLFVYLDQKRQELGDENVPLEDYESLVTDIYKTQQIHFPHKPFLELRDHDLYYIPTHNKAQTLVDDILLNQQFHEALEPLIKIAHEFIQVIPNITLKKLDKDFNSLLLTDDEAVFTVTNDRYKTLSLLYIFVNMNTRHRIAYLKENPTRASREDIVLLGLILKDLDLIKRYLLGFGEVFSEDELKKVLLDGENDKTELDSEE